MSVWSTAGAKPRPCPPIDGHDYRQLEYVQGGCVVEVESRQIEVVVRSVVGDMVFGDCSYEHDLRIDSKGGTFLVGITAGGPSPCPDVGGCDHENVRPWRGQIESVPGEGLVHVVEACLDTCMGQFVGELRLGLRQVDGRWVQTADEALVGDTGYRLDGSWDVGGRHLDIRSDGSASGDAAGIWRLAREPVGWPLELG